MAEDRQHEAGRSLIIADGVLYGADRQVACWLARRVASYSPTPTVRALGILKAGKLVAGVAYEHFNGAHVEAVIAGDGGRWASRAVLRRIFGYPFGQLGVQAITVSVPMSNLASLNLATKLGFQPEALVTFAAHDGGTLVILKAFKDTCEWVGGDGQEGRRQGTSGTGSV